MNSVFLQQADWDALAEHALTPYLPFLGGVAVNSRFNYSGPRAKKVNFYVVEYESDLFCRAGSFRLNTAQDFLDYRSKFPAKEFEHPDEEEEDESGLEGDSASMKAKCCEEWSSKGFEIEGMVPSQKSLSLGRKSFLKTGLASSTAKARGGKDYSKIFFEGEILDPHYSFKKPPGTRASVIERLVQLKLFYSFWKDQSWLFSPKRLLYGPDLDGFSHMNLIASPVGFAETLVWKNVDQKVSYAIEVFKQLNGLSNRDLGAAYREVFWFNHAWRWVAQIKQRQYVYLREFHFWPEFYQEQFDKVRQMRNWGLSMPNTKELNFLRKIGFQSKWLPVDADDLNRIYELSAEQFTIPGVGSWTDDYAVPYP